MDTVHCPICDADIERPADGICPDCGVALDQASATVASPASHTHAPAEGGDCPVCGATVPPGSKVCDACGVDLAAARALLDAPAPGAAAPATDDADEPEYCPSCGTERRLGAAFCRECGEPFPREATDEGLLTPGEFLSGRYQVERRLGGGGMGAVYLARDVNLKGKPVAIKAVLNSDDPALLAAARQEAENLLGIDHPNIVTLRDIVEKGSIPFLVMDYLEGPDWNDLYEQRVLSRGEAFTAEEALQMILGILPAFAYLHGRTPPIVYRDFKPGQVKLVREAGTDRDRHVLLDLGVAYSYTGKPVEAWGTKGYAPPEIGGVCLQPPSMDLATICRTIQGLLGIDLNLYPYGSLPPMEEVPWIPEELYYLLERGTALEPRRRFQRLEDLRAQLEGVLRLIQGRSGTLPRPSGAFAMPVVSRMFTGNLHRTTGSLLSLPVPDEEDPAAPALETASELLLEGKAEEALGQAEAALEINPKSNTGHLIRTVALHRVGREQEAIAELEQISQLPDIAGDWSYAIVAAQLAEASGDHDRAEALYRELIRMLPGEIPPRQRLANLLHARGRHTEAAAIYEQIVGADPANVEAILNLADALAATGQSERSIQVLREVGENAVRFVDAQLRMIELLLERADGEPEALTLAAEAIESLQARTQTPLYYRLVGDWWFEAYRHKITGRNLDKIKRWPLSNGSPTQKEIADRAREAYRHFLRVAPQSPLRDEIIGRIHFGIKELM